MMILKKYDLVHDHEINIELARFKKINFFVQRGNMLLTSKYILVQILKHCLFM